MSTASSTPYRPRFRPALADIARRSARASGDLLRARFGGAHLPGIPAFVLRGWRPREIGLASPARSLWARLFGTAAAAFTRMAEWQERERALESLLRLDDHALRDIGLTRFDVERYPRKPFRHR